MATTKPMKEETEKPPEKQDIDINNVPTLQLKQLFRDIEVALKKREVEDKKKALARMREVAAEFGLTLRDVLGDNIGRKIKTPVTPKYRNPATPHQTWSGRGHRPKWVKDALAGGITLEELGHTTRE